MKLETKIAIDTTVQQPFHRDVVGFVPTFLHLEIQDNPIVYRYGGNEPTESTGHNIAAGGYLILQETNDIENLKFRAVTDPAVGIVTLDQR